MSRVMLDSPAQRLRSRFVLLALRVIVGWGFIAHGYAKWHKGPGAFATILQALGVPAPHLMSWITILVEIFGGVAVLLGAFVAWWSAPMIVLMLVAMVSVHLPYGFSSIKLLSVSHGRAQFGPPGYECDLLYICCLIALALGSPLAFSFDEYRFRRRTIRSKDN